MVSKLDYVPNLPWDIPGWIWDMITFGTSIYPKSDGMYEIRIPYLSLGFNSELRIENIDYELRRGSWIYEAQFRNLFITSHYGKIWLIWLYLVRVDFRKSSDMKFLQKI